MRRKSYHPLQRRVKFIWGLKDLPRGRTGTGTILTFKSLCSFLLPQKKPFLPLVCSSHCPGESGIVMAEGKSWKLSMFSFLLRNQTFENLKRRLREEGPEFIKEGEQGRTVPPDKPGEGLLSGSTGTPKPGEPKPAHRPLGNLWWSTTDIRGRSHKRDPLPPAPSQLQAGLHSRLAQMSKFVCPPRPC